MSFVQRILEASITLASGNFAGGGNSLTLSGLRMSAIIEASGGPSSSTLELTIYGMTLSQMNQLSTVGSQLYQQNQNHITLKAGDAQAGMATAFKGDIFNAFVDAQQMPNVCLRISAKPGASTDVQPTTPTSVKGTSDVATVMKQLAQKGGWALENNGVNVKLNNMYLAGAIGQQMRTLARHAGIEFFFDHTTSNAVITPPGQARQGSSTPLISPQTGMIGYPCFNQAQVIVRVIFNQSIQFYGKVTIQSDLTAACGSFTVFHVVHELECEVPRGKWFSVLSAFSNKSGSSSQKVAQDAGDGGST